MHFRPWIPDSVFFVQECIDADRVSDLLSTVFCYYFADLKKWEVSNPFTKHPTDVRTTFAQQILRFCVGWLQKISCWNALVCGTSMSLLGAEQYFAGCLWIDCCGCHQCAYRFEHRLRTLEMRVDFCMFALSSSETCVFCLFVFAFHASSF